MEQNRNNAAKKRVEFTLKIINENRALFFKPSSYKGFLCYMADMSHFDYYNCILFCLQSVKVNQQQIKKRASNVAGFGTWNKKNVSLKRGATGLIILMPFKNNKIVEEAQKDEKGEYNYDKDGHIKTKVTKKNVIDMTTGSVFDISQTNAIQEEKSDRFVIHNKNDFKNLFLYLREILVDQGFYIYFDSPANNEKMISLESYSIPSKRKIVVRNNLDATLRVQLIVYEFVFCKVFLSLNDEQRSQKDYLEKLRHIALSVSFMFSHYYKLNTNKFDFPTSDKWIDSDEDLHFFLNTIQSTFQAIIEEIEYLYILDQKNLKEESFFDFMMGDEVIDS